MNEPADIGDLELAALISSRICHDVISPVGAIANGLEMLGEEQDEAMREQAMDLIRKSASQASAKLQFARLAFGAAGSAGAEIDLRDAETGGARLRRKGQASARSGRGRRATLPKNKVKLLLNLVALGVVALPRGGRSSRDQASAPRSASWWRPGRGRRDYRSMCTTCLPARTACARRPLDPALLRKPHRSAAGMTVSGRDPRQGSRAEGGLRRFQYRAAK